MLRVDALMLNWILMIIIISNDSPAVDVEVIIKVYLNSYLDVLLSNSDKNNVF